MLTAGADEYTHVSMLTAQWHQMLTNGYTYLCWQHDDKQIHVSMLTACWLIDTCIYADSMLIPDADKQIHISMLTACWHQMLTNRYTYLCWQHLPRNTHIYADMCWYQMLTETFIYVDSTCHRVLLLDADRRVYLRWQHADVTCRQHAPTVSHWRLSSHDGRSEFGVLSLMLNCFNVSSSADWLPEKYDAIALWNSNSCLCITFTYKQLVLQVE